MTTYSRPGVYVRENIVQQNIDSAANRSDAIASFIGSLPKGPTTPTLVASWSDFIKNFGGLDYAYPTSVAVYLFFSNGGRDTYITRCVGTGAASASATIVNAAEDTDVYTVSAVNVGTWANDLAVDVIPDIANPDRFSLYVYGAPLSSSQDEKSNLLEQFTDLGITSTDARYALSIVNSFSSYIRLADLDSGEVPSTNSVLLPLTGGNNGATPDIGDFSDVYPLFDTTTTPLIFNAPDFAYWADSGDSALAAAGLSAYAEGRGDGFVIIDTPYGMSANDATQYASSAKSGNLGSNAAVYYPWLVIPDTSRSTPGVVVAAPPGGAVLGQYQATDSSRGVFKAPAGYGTRLNNVVALEKRLTNSELDSLNTANVPVNAIRVTPGSGIVIMGGRTMANTVPNRYINMRRSLIYVKKELTDRSQFAVFENNDEYLWNSIRTKLSNFLNQYWQAGGLRGTTPGQAFYVKCDGTNNTDTDIAEGRVNIEVGIALEYPAEFIVITIGQVSGSASVVQG